MIVNSGNNLRRGWKREPECSETSKMFYSDWFQKVGSEEERFGPQSV